MNKNIKHFLRYRQIIKVLMKHGLGYLVHRMGMERYIPMATMYSRQICEKEPDSCLAEKLRYALMELGPTFVKLGQLLSTRPDILPPAFIEELEQLQDKVLPVPYPLIVEQITREIGDPNLVFREFGQEPLAAASIGQVHTAVLKTGEQVIVKVQRPGIEEQVENDLEIIIGLAQLIEKRSPDFSRLGLAAVIQDYANIFIKELDYAREAKNTDRMRKDFIDDERVIIPQVYWEFTTSRILTEEYVAGIKFNDLTTIEKRGFSRREISKLATETFLTQVFVHGFFHADPHPGNMLIIDENHISYIDMGETGSLTEGRLRYLTALFIAISKKDIDGAMAALYDMGILNEDVDIDDFEEAFFDVVDRVWTSNMDNIDINRLRQEIMELAFTFHLRLPSYLTALMKALITVEGVGKKLDPSFKINEVATTVLTKVLERKISPENISKTLHRSYYRDIKPLFQFPGNLNRLVKQTGEGKLFISHQLAFTREAANQLAILTNRLDASLIIAGGLISSAVIIHAGNHSSVHLNDILTGISIGAILIGLWSFFSGGRNRF